jgi:hypothetical protein
MSEIQIASFISFAKKFDFSKYGTLSDIGGASGQLSIQVALNNERARDDGPLMEPLMD